MRVTCAEAQTICAGTSAKARPWLGAGANTRICQHQVEIQQHGHNFLSPVQGAPQLGHQVPCNQDWVQMSGGQCQKGQKSMSTDFEKLT